MTDHQFDAIIDMVDLILDGCRDLQEAREKIKSLKKSLQVKEQVPQKELASSPGARSVEPAVGAERRGIGIEAAPEMAETGYDQKPLEGIYRMEPRAAANKEKHSNDIRMAIQELDRIMESLKED